MNKTPKVDQKFLYTIPKVNRKLSKGARVAIEMAALASRLVLIERTRCVHPDGKPENVAEHSLMLAKVAPELAHILYPNLDENLVARFAVLHDDVEAYVGDTATDILANLDQAAKEARESAGLEQLRQEYAHMPSYVRLIEQYETQSASEARFVRAVDKLMVLFIHLPNTGAVLKNHYTYDSFGEAERTLLDRDSHKYGEFDLIKQLRSEIGAELANDHLGKS